MSIPPPDPEIEVRLRTGDLGLPPALGALLDARDDLRRALSTACRLAWSREPWAARQGVELCRALATSEPIAAAVLLAPLRPAGGREQVTLTEGPWLPVEVLSRLAEESRETAWGATVRDLVVRETPSAMLPPLPERLRSLRIESAPELSLDASPALPFLETLSVIGAPQIEPWQTSALSGHRGWVRAVGWHPRGELAATAGSDAVVRLWTRRGSGFSSLAELEGHARPVVALAFSPRGDALATASTDGSVRVWQESGGIGNGRWQERAVLTHPAEVTELAWSPDGLRIATVADDPIVRVWSLGRDGWRPEELPGHGGLVQAVAWAPDGVRLASAAGDGTARLWIDQGHRFEEGGVLVEHDDWVRALAWSRAGDRIVTGSDDGTAQMVSVRSGALARLRKSPTRADRGVSLTGHAGWVRSVAFDRSGGSVATAADDGVLRIFAATEETTERAPRATVEHPARITALGWSPGGGAIATGDDAGTLRVFRGAQELAVVEGHAHEGTIGAIAWHPTRPELWTGSDDRTARVWRPGAEGLGPAWGALLVEPTQ